MARPWNRLVELYGAGLQLDLAGDDSLVAALEGVSPAFIREQDI